MVAAVSRAQVLGFRARAQQLDREPGTRARLADTAVLDLGVQDTGADGGAWALAARGRAVTGRTRSALILLWTLRGAPHLYRRADLPQVLAAVAPFSSADAGKRIFDAARPLRAAGIDPLAGLDQMAEAMRSVVTRPMTKGEVSTAVTALLPPPFLRYCRSCQATHAYEQVFRLGALRAGLELVPGTSPPVLAPIDGFPPPADDPGRCAPIRAYLRLLGPATPKHVAEYLDSPVREVTARWPEEAVEVRVDGERRWVLPEDVPRLAADPPRTTRLLGPFDLFLQARDRSLLAPDQRQAKELWPVLGRPGAVLVNGELVGTWRPRTSDRALRVLARAWSPWSPAVREAVTAQAERLAAHRGVRLAGVDVST